MKKFLLILIATSLATLLMGRISVAQEKSICQPEEIDFQELAGKVKAHTVRLKDLECFSQDLSNKARLLAKQVEKADAATAKALKVQAAKVQKALKMVEALKAKIEEIEAIKGETPFAKRFKAFLENETKAQFDDVAAIVEKIKIDLDKLAGRVNILEENDKKQDGRLDVLEKTVFSKQDKLKFGLAGGVWVSRPGVGAGIGPSLAIPLSEKVGLGLEGRFGTAPSRGCFGYAVGLGLDFKVSQLVDLKVSLLHFGDTGYLKTALRSSTLGLGPGISFQLQDISISFEMLIGVGTKPKGGTQFDAGTLIGLTHFF